MTDAEIHELTGAYSVDALDPQERRRFEAHLSECESCSREVAQLQATAAALGATNVDVPGPGVKRSVMAQIRSTPQDTAATARQRGATTATVSTLPTRHRTPWLAVAASVLLVALVVLGAWAGSLYRTNAKLSAESAKVKAVITAPDAAVASGQVAGGGRAVVVVSKSAAESVFVGSNLAQPTSGKTYQLWYISAAGSATSAGTFNPGSDGSVIQRLAGTTPSATVAVGLTLEPSGGSTQPTTKPVSVIHVSA
jgi:anti-sigma-K factor RskA